MRSPETPAETVERASGTDLVQLTYDSGPQTVQVGAVLVLDTASPLDLAQVRAVVSQRVQAVPRLRQRLHATPPGCGPPVWVDDPGFDIARHLTAAECPAPGDERALLDLAAAVVTTRLPPDRPLWAATLVRGLAAGRTALILRFHHVLADGVGGLAILTQLVDGAPARAGAGFPRRLPSRSRLAVDALNRRWAVLRNLPAGARQVGWALLLLRPSLARRAPRWSLNRPLGPRRALAVARCDLGAARATAHAHGGKVNDVVLAAVSGALRAWSRGRGETLDRVVVSVPVSAHLPSDTDRFANNTAVIPVTLPTTGGPAARLDAAVHSTRTLRIGSRGAAAVLLNPAFRVAARLGILRWYIGRQRRVNTFVTNLRGPAERLGFLGAPVSDVIVVNAISGNVAVAFGVLSYAGRLNVTVVADPEAADPAGLAALLQRELDRLTASQGAAPGTDGGGTAVRSAITG